MKCIYALQLMNNKFYVGSTYNIYVTLKHVFSRKTEKDQWLKLHTPLYVDKVVHGCDPEEEYKYLLKYIRKYGVDNVRGPLFESITYEQESLQEVAEKIDKTLKDL